MPGSYAVSKRRKPLARPLSPVQRLLCIEVIETLVDLMMDDISWASPVQVFEGLEDRETFSRLSLRRVETALRSCTAMSLVLHRGGKYSLSKRLRHFLEEGRPLDIGELFDGKKTPSLKNAMKKKGICCLNCYCYRITTCSCCLEAFSSFGQVSFEWIGTGVIGVKTSPKPNHLELLSSTMTLSSLHISKRTIYRVSQIRQPHFKYLETRSDLEMSENHICRPGRILINCTIGFTKKLPFER